MLEYLIRTYTNEGETVLDNCMGSGSTGVACVHTGRDFIGIELDEHYFQVASERIQREIDTPRQMELDLRVMRRTKKQKADAPIQMELDL